MNFVKEPPWAAKLWQSRDTLQPKRLNRLETRKFLEGYFYNVGDQCDDPEMFVINALADRHSLVDWFGTSNVQYDDDYAVEVATKLMESDG